VIVNTSTWRDSAIELNDPACIINPGEHRYFQNRSYVFYKKAILTTMQELDKGIQGGVLQPHDDCTEEFLNKVLDGAANSRFIINDILEVLQTQGLID